MSSKRRIRRKQCTGKKAWRDEPHAQAYCNARWKKGIRLVPYTCRWCGKIHVGHIPGRLQNPRRTL